MADDTRLPISSLVERRDKLDADMHAVMAPLLDAFIAETGLRIGGVVVTFDSMESFCETLVATADVRTLIDLPERPLDLTAPNAALAQIGRR